VILKMPYETLLDHVADIVSAHVSNNSVSANDLPGLIQSVYASLAALGQAPAPIEEKLTPAVSVRASVKPDAIACLECGSKFKMLKRHLGTDHNMTPAEYRQRWNLPSDYPMVAPEYAAMRGELAKKIGLGRKPGVKVKPAAKAEAKALAAPKAPAKAPAKTKPVAAAKPRKKLGVAFDSVAAVDMETPATPAPVAENVSAEVAPLATD
jgi:predicted transcriptional regulator